MKSTASPHSHIWSNTVTRVGVLGVLYVAFGCSDNGAVGPIPVEGSTPSQVVVDVTSFGARGDDDIDDTKAFESAVRALPDKGGTIIIPSGVYMLSASGRSSISRAIDLFRLSNVTLSGDGIGQTVLRMAPGVSYKGDTHIVLVDRSSGITIRDLTIDGNRNNVTYNDEQSHGVDVHGSTKVRFERVLFTGMHGDGIRLLGTLGPTPMWVDQVWVEDCRFAENGRSGIAVQRAVRGLTVTRSTFTRISDQAIDMEPTGGSSNIAPRDFAITNNLFFETASLAMTITGISVQDPARNIVVSDNELQGTGIFVFNAQDVRIEANVIRSGLRWSPIEVRKGSERVWIVDNEIDARATQKPAIALMFHTSRAPKDVNVINNTIRTAGYAGFYARDAERLSITGNRIYGDGSRGVVIDDILAGSPLAGFLIEGNEFDGFQVGIRFVSRGDAATGVCLRGNEFTNIQTRFQTEGPIEVGCAPF